MAASIGSSVGASAGSKADAQAQASSIASDDGNSADTFEDLLAGALQAICLGSGITGMNVNMLPAAMGLTKTTTSSGTSAVSSLSADPVQTQDAGQQKSSSTIGDTDAVDAADPSEEPGESTAVKLDKLPPAADQSVTAAATSQLSLDVPEGSEQEDTTSTKADTAVEPDSASTPSQPSPTAATSPNGISVAQSASTVSIVTTAGPQVSTPARAANVPQTPPAASPPTGTGVTQLPITLFARTTPSAPTGSQLPASAVARADPEPPSVNLAAGQWKTLTGDGKLTDAPVAAPPNAPISIDGSVQSFARAGTTNPPVPQEASSRLVALAGQAATAAQTGTDLAAAPKSIQAAETVPPKAQQDDDEPSAPSASSTATSLTGPTAVLTPSPGTPQTSGPAPQQSASASPVIDQVADGIASRAAGLKQGGTVDFYMRLNPPELGTVFVHLRATENTLSARLVVGDATARSAIESQLPQLRVKLGQSGMSLGGFDVASQQSNTRQSRQQWQDEPSDGKTSNSGTSPASAWFSQSSPATGTSQVDVTA